MSKEILDKSIYLMPFTATSILLYSYLKEHGVDVLGFCDNNAELNMRQSDGKPIFLPSVAYEENHGATVVLCEMKFFDEMVKQTMEIGFGYIIKVTGLSIDFDLKKHTYILEEEDYSSLAPRQIQWGRSLVRMAPTLRTWRGLIEHLINLNIKPYKFKESDLPSNYNFVKAFRFIVCINATKVYTTEYEECLLSLKNQLYSNFLTLITCTKKTERYIKETTKSIQTGNCVFLIAPGQMENIDTIEFIRTAFTGYTDYDYALTLGADDKLTKNALAMFNIKSNEFKNYKVLTANEDRIYGDEYISPYYKEYNKKFDSINTAGLLRNLVCVDTKMKKCVREINVNEIYVIEDILYHYRIYKDTTKKTSIKAIALYLPQFHAIPENDEWWGEGFTEWTNVRRAYPMFEGHYQPRIPSELGYYDLVNDKDIQKKQLELAKKYGIYGFCYYYYWFNGRRLLEKPLDNILNNPEFDMPFCICWANENWTRRWDGLENEILMEQKHSRDSDEQFIIDVLPILKDPRYIRVNGAPLLLIYRYNLFPDFRNTVGFWRQKAKESGLDDIHISIVETTGWTGVEFGDLNCDSETEMPPWGPNMSTINDSLANLNENFTGWVFDYVKLIYQRMNTPRKKHLWFGGAAIGFDNTARRMEKAYIFHGSTPENYQKLLMSLVDSTSRYPEDEQIIFINAWNEWAESTYLEPDEKYGDAYLKATQEALTINC